MSTLKVIVMAVVVMLALIVVPTKAAERGRSVSAPTRSMGGRMSVPARSSGGRGSVGFSGGHSAPSRSFGGHDYRGGSNYRGGRPEVNFYFGRGGHDFHHYDHHEWSWYRERHMSCWYWLGGVRYYGIPVMGATLIEPAPVYYAPPAPMYRSASAMVGGGTSINNVDNSIHVNGDVNAPINSAPPGGGEIGGAPEGGPPPTSPFSPCELSALQGLFPQGFHVADFRRHEHGGDKGQLNWVKVELPNGERKKVEYENSKIQKTEDGW